MTCSVATRGGASRAILGPRRPREIREASSRPMLQRRSTAIGCFSRIFALKMNTRRDVARSGWSKPGRLNGQARLTSMSENMNNHSHLTRKTPHSVSDFSGERTIFEAPAAAMRSMHRRLISSPNSGQFAQYDGGIADAPPPCAIGSLFCDQIGELAWHARAQRVFALPIRRLEATRVKLGSACIGSWLFN